MSDPLSCLHLVSASPRRSGAFSLCVSLLRPGDAVLLLEDGVNALLDEFPARLLDQPIELACLAADIEARGITGLVESSQVNLVDDSGFVELVERYPLSQTWT